MVNSNVILCAVLHTAHAALFSLLFLKVNDVPALQNQTKQTKSK
jgi:hypothetical protein